MRLRSLLACWLTPSINGTDDLPFFVQCNSPKIGLDRSQHSAWTQYDDFEITFQR